MSYGGYGIGGLVRPGGINAYQSIEEAQQIEQQQEMAPIESELARYKLQGAQQESELARTGYENAMIAQAARTAMDDPQKWDANMQALADKGIDGARQFIGKYSPEIADRVTSAYDTQTPLARAAKPASAAPAETADYDRLYSRTDPSQFPQLADRAGKMLNLIDSVHDQQSYEAAKATATKMGIPGAAQMGPWNDFATPQIMRDMHNHLVDQYAYLQGRISGQATGEPAPLVPAKTEKLGDTLYSVDENTPTGVATASPIAHEAKSTLIGLDSQGHPLYHDTTGGGAGEGPADTVGPYKVAQPAGARGGLAGGATEWKYRAALASGMSQPDALQYAAGRKAMSQEQIDVTAAKMADSDLHSEVMASGPMTPEEENTFKDQHTEYWKTKLSEDSLRTQTATAPTTGPVPKGMVRYNGQNYTVQQATASAKAALATARAHKDNRAVAAILARAKQMGLDTRGL